MGTKIGQSIPRVSITMGNHFVITVTITNDVSDRQIQGEVVLLSGAKLNGGLKPWIFDLKPGESFQHISTGVTPGCGYILKLSLNSGDNILHYTTKTFTAPHLTEDLELRMSEILEQEDVQFYQQGTNFTSSSSKCPSAAQTKMVNDQAYITTNHIRNESTNDYWEKRSPSKSPTTDAQSPK